jgi:hypothetical protein
VRITVRGVEKRPPTHIRQFPIKGWWLRAPFFFVAGLTLPTGLGFDVELTYLVGVALGVSLLSLLLNVVLAVALLALWLSHWRKAATGGAGGPRQVDVGHAE